MSFRSKVGNSGGYERYFDKIDSFNILSGFRRYFLYQGKKFLRRKIYNK